MYSVILAALAALLTTPWVVIHWLHSRGRVAGMRALIHRWRRRSMSLGALCALASVGLVLYRQDMHLFEPVAPLVAVAALAMLYARLFQFLRPRPAPLMVPVEDDALDPAELVAVLPEGSAITMEWLATMRTARRREVVVVHCRMPRSLLAVHSPDYKPIAAVLPHSSGFEIGAAGRLWDGVSGQALDGKAALERAPVALCTARAWREAFPEGPLLGPAGGLPATLKHDAVLVPPPGSGAGDDQWGAVEGGRWRELSAAQLDEAPQVHEGALTGDRYFLSRRAARARYIDGA